jgi:hypothetical protein
MIYSLDRKILVEIFMRNSVVGKYTSVFWGMSSTVGKRGRRYRFEISNNGRILE